MRIKITLTEEQIAIVEEMVQRASEMGIPTTPQQIVRQFVERGFELIQAAETQSGTRKR